MQLRGLAKYLLYNYVPPKSGKLPYYGTDIYFQNGSLLIRELCFEGSFEPDVIGALRQFATHGTVFDVGANIGLMAAPVLHSNDTVKVVCFEPSSAVANLLALSISKSPYRSRWDVVQKAVSDAPGEVQFADDTGVDPLFGRIAGHNEPKIASRPVIEATTLDLEWEKRGCPEVSVIKIDVEGAEPLVLEGASSLISTCRPVIVTEWHLPYLERYGAKGTHLFDFATERQYNIYSLPHYIPSNKKEDLSVQMTLYTNFVLIPTNRE